MLRTWCRREAARNAAGYGLTVLLTIAVLTGLTRLWQADLGVPLGNYGGDTFLFTMMVRSVHDQGWYLTNPSIGAPFGNEMYDLPVSEGLNFGILKLLGYCGCDHFAAVNLYFLLSFPLAAVTCYVVLRHFGGRRLAAVAASLLFTFLPYHFGRGIGHLFLACYYLIPLMAMLALWVYQEPGLLFAARPGDARPRFRPLAPRALAGMVVSLLVASAGIYYAFFGCFFLTVAGACRAAALRRRAPLVSAAFFIGVIVAAGLLNLTPHLLYAREHGKNKLVHRTMYVSAETWALRVTQMVLPLPDHRVPALARLRARYDASQTAGENTTATLGAVGTVGFLLLLACLFHRRPLTAAPDVERGLAILNGAGLLLGTFGGFGALFALLVSPAIRCYNRISIYLAFFALFALVLLFERAARRCDRTAAGRWLLRLGLGLAAAGGVYDQTPRALFAEHGPLQAAFRNDAAFIAAVEARVPAGAMVYQLPYVPFLEAPAPGRMADYDHLRAYLHSRALRWSYGAMKGRAGDVWQARLAALPIAEQAATLAYAGFAGIYVDRLGYDDGAAKLEAELRALLHVEPLVSGDGRLSFFDLAPYAASRRAATPASAWARWQSRALHPPLLFWDRGFTLEEKVGGRAGRWAFSPQATMSILNTRPEAIEVVLTFRLAGPVPSTAVQVDAPFIRRELSLAPTVGDVVELRFTVPPGRHPLHFTCVGPWIDAPGPPVNHYFAVVEAEVRETPDPAGVATGG